MDKGLMIALVIIGIVVLLGTHYFLSTRKHWAFGSLFPICYLAFAIWVMTSQSIDTYTMVKIGMGLIIFLGIWSDGRDKVKQKRLKEVDKMKVKDIT